MGNDILLPSLIFFFSFPSHLIILPLPLPVFDHSYPAIMMAAIRPRSFWPEFLWTNKDFIQFSNDAVKDQVHGKESLLKTQSKHPSLMLITQKLNQINSSRLQTTLPPLLQLFNSAELAFDSLSYLHLRMIAYSLSICSLPFYNFILPSRYLIQSMDKAINDIIFDDNLLRNDLDILSQLTNKEILKRCVVRGLIPYSEVNLDDEWIEKVKQEVKSELELLKTTEANRNSDRKKIRGQRMAVPRDQELYTADAEDTAEEERIRKDDDISEKLILRCGKWNRLELEEHLGEWLHITEKIIKGNVANRNSLISHLIVFGYPRRGS